jgi:hypothetical protein
MPTFICFLNWTDQGAKNAEIRRTAASATEDPGRKAQLAVARMRADRSRYLAKISRRICDARLLK